MTPGQTITISQLIGILPDGSYSFQGDADQVIEWITWDFQKVKPNSLYFCVEDEEFQESHIATNALAYRDEAVNAGAVCLVTERGKITNVPQGISLLEVNQLNPAMALIAREFFRNPMAAMKLIGITGTNGKTTTSQLVDSILIQAGNKTGVIGTVGIFYPSGKQEASHLSNPMATELFAIADQMRQEEVDCLTMEVTSHAGAFDRNHAIDFDIAVFTNLTQDHLDYHKTVDAYKECKLRHFRQLGKGKKKAYGIVNVDDVSGNDFVAAISEHARKAGDAEILTYGIRNKDADLVAYPKQMTGGFSEFDIFLKGNHLSHVFLPMPGLFNIYNSLAAFGATFALGISIDEIVKGLKNARKVDGRFERVNCNTDFEVYVDYAHTPDSLEKILSEIKGITRKNVIAVFGCGGDRDRSKRGIMGKIATGIADICVVTSDNPRSEDPAMIIKDITDGIPQDIHCKIIVEPDRRQAIYTAMEMASADDSVLIAGKGHEDYQIIGTTKYPFLDRRVVQDYFQLRQRSVTRAWVEVNRGVVRRNFELIMADKPGNLKLMAVVKDDAVGHGMIEMAMEAVKAGCSYLATSCVAEAMSVRKTFEDFPIMIFGERLDCEIPQCIRHGFTLQIQSLAKAKIIGQFSKNQHCETKVHLKVDTGMGRYGVRWDRAVALYKEIQKVEGIQLEGIMTHFAQSDEAKKDYANLQWQRFSEIVEQLKSERIAPALVHACNTGGYLDLPHAHGNMVRTSILPTGVYPSKVCRRINVEGEELQSAMEVFSCVSFVKDLSPGDKLGYGMHFTADRETKIAVLPIGYGDGYPRLRNKGHVLIHGVPAPIVGGNGMDATMVDVTHISEVKAGDRVVLIGKQGKEEITAMMLADWAGTVTYHILAGWTQRMEKVFV